MGGAGEGEDVITTVAELSPRSVVSLSSVRREASKIIPPPLSLQIQNGAPPGKLYLTFIIVSKVMLMDLPL